MANLVLYAPGVHVGGGLVLLRELIKSSEGRIARFYLDARTRDKIELPKGARCSFVNPGMFGRLAGELNLIQSLSKHEVLFCFHGLPPLLPRRAKTFVYVQNRNLLEVPLLDKGKTVRDYRNKVKRWMFRVLRRNVSEYIVQTESMRDALAGVVGQDRPINVFPFFLDSSELMAKREECQRVKYDFVYVSDGESHKNHKRLIEAWIMLAKEGIRPGLCLTVPERHYKLLRYIESVSLEFNLAITNLGEIPHNEVYELYNKAGALVFPSFSESLGLPLIEARLSGIPVIAAELDYVRDICNPVETFDPMSAKSIARSIKRFAGIKTEPPEIMSGKVLLDMLDNQAQEQ